MVYRLNINQIPKHEYNNEKHNTSCKIEHIRTDCSTCGGEQKWGSGGSFEDLLDIFKKYFSECRNGR